MSHIILNPQQMPKRPIRSIPFDEMRYTDMLVEIGNVKERLNDRFIKVQERIDLRKYLRKLEKEVYDFEEFRGIPHTAV